MSNALSNGVGNAFRTCYGTREETSGECARTRARHQSQTPEPITTTHGQLLAAHCPALTTDRAREPLAMTRSTGCKPDAASCADQTRHDADRRRAHDQPKPPLRVLAGSRTETKESNQMSEYPMPCGLCAQGASHSPCTFGLELTTPPPGSAR